VSQDEYNRLALGRPVVTPLTLDSIDEDARAFLLSRTGSRFTMLTLTASFALDDSKPFESAWVDVSIGPSDDQSMEAPIAWSMRPMSEADVSTVVRNVTVDASLKLSFPGVPGEAGPSASRGSEEKFERPLIKVEALNEGTSSPRWVFYRTNASEIRGIHRMCMVIDIPGAQAALAKVSIGATIRLRRFKLFRYTAVLIDAPEVASVVLPAP
jgi:hypothetical protein